MAGLDDVFNFPNPEVHSTEEGIVALGGDLTPERLISAYRQGIFPWPISGLPLTWFCPPERAILEWDRLHIPRSLARARRKLPYDFTFDRCFHQVIQACADSPRPGQDGTWITPAMMKAYDELHLRGHAHSVEVWDEEQTLIGGLYGVDAGGVFAAESMFYVKPYASKLAILFLMEHLHSRSRDWLDIQVITPHMEAMGAYNMTRAHFLKKLTRGLDQELELFGK